MKGKEKKKKKRKTYIDCAAVEVANKYGEGVGAMGSVFNELDNKIGVKDSGGSKGAG